MPLALLKAALAETTSILCFGILMKIHLLLYYYHLYFQIIYSWCDMKQETNSNQLSLPGITFVKKVEQM